MSLLLAYTFNDNNASSFADFSGNKQTGSGTLSGIVAGQNYGHAANFNATNNYISVTPTNVSGITALTFFASINLAQLPPNPGQNYYLINQVNCFNIKINGSGNILFTTGSVGAGTNVTVTSAGVLTASAWHTIACVADGANMYIYIDGVVDANMAAQTHLLFTNTAIYIGNDTSVDTASTFNGYIDCIEIRSVAHSTTGIANLHASPGGVLISNAPNNFATGDLIADSTVTYQAVVTWSVDTSSFYIYPITVVDGGAYQKIGNIYQTARQQYFQQQPDFDGNGNGQIKIIFPIAGFADYSSPANSYTIDNNGVSALVLALTGSTGVTQTASDNSTKLATTAMVQSAIVANTADYWIPIQKAMGSIILAQSFPAINIVTTPGLGSQSMIFQAIYLNKAQTLTGVKWYQATAFAGTGNQYNGFGLYSYSAGTLTLVASSTNDANIWKQTSNTYGTKAFSGTYSAAAGIYFIGILYCSSAVTTSPQWGGGNTALSGAQTALDFTNSVAFVSSLSTVTALPTTQAASGLAATVTAMRWIALY